MLKEGSQPPRAKKMFLKYWRRSINGFKTSAISASLIECNGEKMRLYGEEARGAAYYNADYYYICEDMKGVLEEAYMEISGEFDLGQTEVPNTTQHDNFNDIWALNFGGRCKFDAKSAGATS